MGSRALDDRLKQFTSLSAALRALSRSIHPAELAPLHEQSRALLIELRELASGNGAEGTLGDKPSPAILDHIDRALAEQSTRTRDFVDRIDMRQLRATVPLTAHQHPEEVCGLIDLLVGGDLESDKNLRTLEFLITLLSAEEHSGRRSLSRDPAQLTERLSATSNEQLSNPDCDWVVAERMLEKATFDVLQGNDVGEIRDRVRRCKEEFGPSLLHPSVLTASVKYNITMWNHVAAEIDSSRSIDELATDLFAETGGPLVAATGRTGSTMLDSREFGSLLDAFTARIRGEEPGTSRFDRCVDGLAPESIAPDRVEDFNDENPDESTLLIRSAVVMGLVLQKLPESGDLLQQAGLDILEFTTLAFDDLTSRMTELARKHFAASEYSEAFRLSDVKTHHLTLHRPVRDHLMGDDTNAQDSRPGQPSRMGLDDQPEETSSWLRQLFAALPAGRVMIGLIVFIPILLLYMSPSIVEDSKLNSQALHAVSPFLVSGHQQQEGESSHFVARVADTWAYLGTSQRREVAREIAQKLEQMGAQEVTLVDSQGLMVVRYANGNIVMVVPHPDDSGSGR